MLFVAWLYEKREKQEKAIEYFSETKHMLQRSFRDTTRYDHSDGRDYKVGWNGKYF